MADTVRSMAEILALMPDNTTGDISPQDMRDAVVSLEPAIGRCFISVPSATTISDTLTPVKAAGTTTAVSGLNNISMPANNRLRYDGTAPINAIIWASMSMTALAASQSVFLSVAKNGVVLPDSLAIDEVGIGGGVERTHAVTVDSLSQNDYVEVFVQNTTSTSSITLLLGTFTVIGFVA